MQEIKYLLEINYIYLPHGFFLLYVYILYEYSILVNLISLF